MTLVFEMSSILFQETSKLIYGCTVASFSVLKKIARGSIEQITYLN